MKESGDSRGSFRSAEISSSFLQGTPGKKRKNGGSYAVSYGSETFQPKRTKKKQNLKFLPRNRKKDGIK